MTSTPSVGDKIPATQSIWVSMVPMLLIFVVFYFLLFRPQAKKRKEQEQLIASAKKGDHVMTISGIFGVIKKVNDADHTVYLEIADNIQVKILRSAISNIISQG